MPELSNVTISIFNINGELVRTLFSDRQAAGKYSVEWNANAEDGNPVKSGIYFYRLQADNFVETKKMFLLK
jgi:flagellar hook assembly protein FlgD